MNNALSNIASDPTRTFRNVDELYQFIDCRHILAVTTRFAKSSALSPATARLSYIAIRSGAPAVRMVEAIAAPYLHPASRLRSVGDGPICIASQLQCRTSDVPNLMVRSVV